KRVLDQLWRTRSDVDRELHATATYPVLTLPNEVTVEIFIRCLWILDPPCIPQCTGSAPFVLSRVCRAWRDIALNTPILWSKLKVWFDQIALRRSSPGFGEDIVDEWLSRAKYHPLSLDFAGPSSRLRNVIHRWSHRMQRFRLDMGPHCDIRALELDSAAFPLLQSATLSCYNYSLPRVHPPPVLFGDAPHFHDIHLCGLPGLNLDRFTLPCLQLTKFHGTIRDLQLFTLAPNLAELRCTFHPNGDDFMVITQRSLRFVDLGEESASLLQYLTLPALRCLKVYNYDIQDWVEPFLRRSSPPLISLTVSGSKIDYWAQHISLVAGTLETLEFMYVSDEDLPLLLHLLDTPILDSPQNPHSQLRSCGYV
ncbi:hypothetical protein C8R45DRAFT_956667, partial [Mycena sanguinolenta]